MTTIRAKSEDLSSLIAEAKGREGKYHRGQFYWKNPNGDNYTKPQWRPHTAEGAHQALQLLEEWLINNPAASRYDITRDDNGFTCYLFEDDIPIHFATNKKVCQAICLAWLAAHGVSIELIDSRGE